MKAFTPLALILAGCFAASDADRKEPENKGSDVARKEQERKGQETLFTEGDKKEGDKKEQEIKYECGYLDKTWGIKFKSATVMKTGGYHLIKVLVEFTKDVDDVAALQKAFMPWASPSKQYPNPGLWIYLFDKDNVTLTKSSIKQLEGEVTGKAGDAFRFVFDVQGGTENYMERLRKVEPRPHQPEKK